MGCAGPNENPCEEKAEKCPECIVGPTGHPHPPLQFADAWETSVHSFMEECDNPQVNIPTVGR